MYADDAAVQKKLAEIEEHDHRSHSHDEGDNFHRGKLYYNSERCSNQSKQTFKTQ